MRRITIWITATLAVAGLLFAFQLNATGTTGKSGDDGNHTQPGVTAPAGSGEDQGKPGDDTAGDGDHAGKPGENK
ncbi:hypothetical protein OG521_01545 [Streptomyces sp. NBC_01463]|uniref:hypothetical protein n=1 Tax=unclassified Streptomyces TaxID=2593676 RepID=UPI0025537E4D|nr:hypothetical protein [Streptomyces sp. RTGN2]WSU63415.1 hypothetical protein OG450_38600 [Streptomyces sp. NBC_01104]